MNIFLWFFSNISLILLRFCQNNNYSEYNSANGSCYNSLDPSKDPLLSLTTSAEEYWENYVLGHVNFSWGNYVSYINCCNSMSLTHRIITIAIICWERTRQYYTTDFSGLTPVAVSFNVVLCMVFGIWMFAKRSEIFRSCGILYFLVSLRCSRHFGYKRVFFTWSNYWNRSLPYS